MESWQRVWRQGLAPLLTVEELDVLAKALRSDDARLIQGESMIPAPELRCSDWPVQAACALAYVGWQANGWKTVAQVEGDFVQLLFQCDQQLGKAGEVRHFIHFWDDTPRKELFPQLLAEVDSELMRRAEELPCA